MKTTTHAKLRFPGGETWICEVPLGTKIGDRLRFHSTNTTGEVISIQPTKPDPTFDPEYQATTRTF
jgi:hypothetical protein